MGSNETMLTFPCWDRCCKHTRTFLHVEFFCPPLVESFRDSAIRVNACASHCATYMYVLLPASTFRNKRFIDVMWLPPVFCAPLCGTKAVYFRKLFTLLGPIFFIFEKCLHFWDQTSFIFETCLYFWDQTWSVSRIAYTSGTNIVHFPKVFTLLGPNLFIFGNCIHLWDQTCSFSKIVTLLGFNIVHFRNLFTFLGSQIAIFWKSRLPKWIPSRKSIRVTGKSQLEHRISNAEQSNIFIISGSSLLDSYFAVVCPLGRQLLTSSTARVSDAPSATVAFVLERSLCFRRFIRGFGSLVFFKELPRFTTC